MFSDFLSFNHISKKASLCLQLFECTFLHNMSLVKNDDSDYLYAMDWRRPKG